MVKKKIEDLDLYELLGVEPSADASEIKKAYRKKALLCHPDKNPDDPRAAETFLELSSALEVLGDEAARAAYDRVLRARQAAKLKHRQLDAKRRKLIEDLERREKEAEQQQRGGGGLSDAQRLAAEMERLQREGSRLLQEEQQRLRQQLLEDQQRLSEAGHSSWDPQQHRIKITWRADKGDPANGGYSSDLLQQFLKKYGDVVALVVSSKKPGSAVVEFASKEASEMALQLEKGLESNPLSLQWAVVKEAGRRGRGGPGAAAAAGEAAPQLVTEKDYESLVLHNLRRQAERQKLIQQMQQDEQLT